MTTDELEQVIAALQDRVQLLSLSRHWQQGSLRTTRRALSRLAARRREIARRDPQPKEA